MKLQELKNEYGNVDIKTITNKNFIHIDIPRISLTCKRLGIEYVPAIVNWGTPYRGHRTPQIRGVVVHRNSLRNPTLKAKITAKHEAEHKQELARIAEQQEREARELQAKLDKQAYYRDKYGVEVELEQLARIHEELGLDLHTEEDWLVYGRESSPSDWTRPEWHVTQGKLTQVYPYYLTRATPNPRAEHTGEQLWQEHLALYDGNEEFAQVELIYIANKLCKILSSKSIYVHKDNWIRANQDKLVEGKVARVETRACWGCDGDGCDRWGEHCDRCYGSGIYSSNTLYEHRFQVQGKDYCFHSYVKPTIISEEKGVDKQGYGYRFAHLPIHRLEDYLKMADYLTRRQHHENQRTKAPHRLP